MLPAICTLYIYSQLILRDNFTRKYYNYPHLTSEKKCNHTMLSNLFKVTHLETGGAQNRTQEV